LCGIAQEEVDAITGVIQFQIAGRIIVVETDLRFMVGVIVVKVILDTYAVRGRRKDAAEVELLRCLPQRNCRA